MVDRRPDSSTRLIFRGTDTEEAESFIQAIRQLAYDENSDGDNAWMARYATTCFRGRAMRWHARLEASVRSDWDLLVQAILDEWPLVEDLQLERPVLPGFVEWHDLLCLPYMP